MTKEELTLTEAEPGKYTLLQTITDTMEEKQAADVAAQLTSRKETVMQEIDNIPTKTAQDHKRLSDELEVINMRLKAFGSVAEKYKKEHPEVVIAPPEPQKSPVERLKSLEASMKEVMELLGPTLKKKTEIAAAEPTKETH